MTFFFKNISTRWVKIGVVFLSLLVSSLSLSELAYADGGAPNLAYVATDTGGIGVIDVAQQKVIRHISLGGKTTTTQLSSDGSTLFTTQPTLQRALVLDAATGKIRCSAHVPGEPDLLVLSKQEDAFFVAGAKDNNVHVFDPKTCQAVRTIPIGGPIYGFTLTLAGGVFPTHTGLYQLCVATTDRVLVLDPDGTRLATFPIPAGPQYLSAPPLDFLIYVTTRQGTVVTIDLKTNKVTAPLLKQGIFGPMDYDETTHEVYVPDQQKRQIAVLTPPGTNETQKRESHQPIRTISLEGVPTTVAITNDGLLGFVALEDGDVLMLDIPGRKSILTFSLAGRPNFIITGVYPPPIVRSENGEKPARTSAQPFQNILLIVLSSIFVVAFVGLLLILRMLWRQRS